MAQTMQPTLQRAYARMPDAFPVDTGTRPFSARAICPPFTAARTQRSSRQR